MVRYFRVFLLCSADTSRLSGFYNRNKTRRYCSTSHAASLRAVFQYVILKQFQMVIISVPILFVFAKVCNITPLFTSIVRYKR